MTQLIDSHETFDKDRYLAGLESEGVVIDPGSPKPILIDHEGNIEQGQARTWEDNGQIIGFVDPEVGPFCYHSIYDKQRFYIHSTLESLGLPVVKTPGTFYSSTVFKSQVRDPGEPLVIYDQTGHSEGIIITKGIGTMYMTTGDCPFLAFSHSSVWGGVHAGREALGESAVELFTLEFIESLKNKLGNAYTQEAMIREIQNLRIYFTPHLFPVDKYFHPDSSYKNNTWWGRSENEELSSNGIPDLARASIRQLHTSFKNLNLPVPQIIHCGINTSETRCSYNIHTATNDKFNRIACFIGKRIE